MIDPKALAKGARQIAFGYFLLHFHVNLNGLDLLVNWGGWLLFWWAIQTLKTVRPKATLLERFCIVLGIWSVIQWQTFFTLPDALAPVTLVLRLVRIYFDFHMLTEMACLAGAIPGGGGEGLSRQILSARTAIVVLQTAMVLSGMVPVPFFHIGLLETLWSGGLFFLVLFQLAFVAFLMYQLFELAKILEQADPFTPENE